ncbi:MAG TPA: thioredoxin family protein [Terriglobales bacterium]|jgi:predicted dithiol-disulfide oxidoreductase (DUF899 family)
MTTSTVEKANVVSRAEWLAARRELLTEEKALTRARDAVSQKRRELPWVKMDKDYVFDGPNGKEKLADLFGGRSQLIIYHFMFAPGWNEGCVGCSFLSDHVDGAVQHLEQHDVSYVAVSRAPLAEITPFMKRMGWKFKWVSSFGTDFNYDFHVSFPKEEVAKGKVYNNFEMQEAYGDEVSGTSVFYKDANGDIFHTYSQYSRGGEAALGTYHFLDLTPKGRNETGPGFNLTDWVRHHDRYGSGGLVQPTGRYQAESKTELMTEMKSDEKSETCCKH